MVIDIIGIELPEPIHREPPLEPDDRDYSELEEYQDKLADDWCDEHYYGGD